MRQLRSRHPGQSWVDELAYGRANDDSWDLMMALADRLHDDAYELAPYLTELRHTLHQSPEIGLQLPITQQTVLAELDGLGLEVSTGTALTSVTAVLRGVPGGPTVLLRGDMDALPVSEATGVEFASKIDGAMHACGHDLHTAMLVGAARLLSAHRDELAGDVVFMFQPGEEGWDGAGDAHGRERPAARHRPRCGRARVDPAPDQGSDQRGGAARR
jgi:metal-dependent amidase/aminoacylase/carboxypeptidase family protein